LNEIVTFTHQIIQYGSQPLDSEIILVKLMFKLIMDIHHIVYQHVILTKHK
jgi:hypothetical protein